MKIGILGGGQLARMLALAGIPLGLQFKFLVASQDNQVNNLGEVIIGSLQNETVLKEFAQDLNVITLENENIPLETLQYLESFVNVYPKANVLTCFQDRLLEKNTFNRIGIPTNQFLEINNREDLENAVKTLGFPFILKKRTNGYDGKHQIKVATTEDLNLESLQYTHCIAEQFVPFDREISIIAACSIDRELAFYDLCENIHINGILHQTQNRKNDPLFKTAKVYIEKLIQDLNYVGTIALELFQVGDKLFANEVAPRVHNSGHWTIEGCVTSQFENHLRAVLNLPLGSTESLSNATMINVISTMPKIQEILKYPEINLHNYHKAPRPGRKLGHITCLKEMPKEVKHFFS